jgi:para-nitrobenzyl esterase
MRHQSFRITTCAAALALSAGAAWAQAEVSAPVGEIAGTEEDGLHIYQGIPFAQAPVGDLRWAPPEPAEPFTETFQATDPGAECVQLATFWRPGKAASWDEDCLSLTVYTPAEGVENAPVFVGFHGGGSRNGAKTDWDPRELAREGNVVVMANYRLGALGYLATQGLAEESQDDQSTGTYGDLDKIQALRWVQESIGAFGGDANRVTIAGQSAGARGVCFLVASPEAEGLLQGAVMESGRNCPSVSAEEQIADHEAFVETIGCAEADDALSCLREKTPAEILSAQEESGMGLDLVHGGYAMPVSPMEAFRSGEFNQVPIMIGNTSDEIRVFVYEGNDLQKQPVTQAQYEETVRSNVGDRAEEALGIYAEAAAEHPGKAMGDFETDRRYVCPTSEAVEVLAEWVPVYAYEFADDTAPIRSYAHVPPSFDLGAPHSAELPYMWGEETVPGGLSPEQQELAQMMRGYLVALTAPDGMAAAGQAEWPAATPESLQRLVLLPGGQTELVSEADYRESNNCGLFAQAGN